MNYKKIQKIVDASTAGAVEIKTEKQLERWLQKTKLGHFKANVRGHVVELFIDKASSNRTYWTTLVVDGKEIDSKYESDIPAQFSVNEVGITFNEGSNKNFSGVAELLKILNEKSPSAQAKLVGNKLKYNFAEAEDIEGVDLYSYLNFTPGLEFDDQVGNYDIFKVVGDVGEMPSADEAKRLVQKQQEEYQKSVYQKRLNGLAKDLNCEATEVAIFEATEGFVKNFVDNMSEEQNKEILDQLRKAKSPDEWGSLPETVLDRWVDSSRQGGIDMLLYRVEGLQDGKEFVKDLLKTVAKPFYQDFEK